MTEVNLNATVDGYRGAIGKLVFKNYKGRTIVCRKPTFTKPPSLRQIARREHFKEAVAYAKSVLADPAARDFYEPIAKERDTSVYWLAIADFLNTPSIKPLDLTAYKGKVGDMITIKATDDLGLAYIDVSIVSQEGTPVEQGKAVEKGARTGIWIYTATAPVPLGTNIFIEVKGVDHAGNEAQLSENPTVGMDE